MSKLYSEKHRALQDRFDSRRMADLMEGGLMHDAFTPDEVAFVESRDMFFLSTVDTFGRPTVSYKGGAPGFLKAPTPSKLVFPSYNGNGMHYSMGNLMDSPRVGLLLIDFETPHRLRVHGRADVSFDDALMAEYPEAEFIVRVAVEEIWINCPRYIHKYQKLGDSKYVPQKGEDTPIPAWKRLDVAQEALPKKDQGKAASQGGEIDMEAYEALVGKGEG